MRPPSRHWPIVALLLALSLPLQGFAAVSACPGLPAAAAQNLQHHVAMAHMHCGEHPGPESSPVQHHGCCADCGMAAVLPATVDFIAPRGDTPPLSLPRLRAPLTISLDRLDRPPRTHPSGTA